MDNIGDITIRTNPSGAMIYVDSVLVTDVAGNPVLTPTRLSLTEGMHRFQFVASGYYEDWAHEYIYLGSDIQLDRSLMPSHLPYGTQMPYRGPGFM